MKKGLIVTIFITLICLFLIPNFAHATMEWSSIKGDADDFIGVGLGHAQTFNIATAVNNIASILTTVGVVIVLGGILITGIKYMTASPDEAAKLKSKLIGLVIAGVVVIGAYGIWMLLGNIFLNATGDIEPITVNVPEDNTVYNNTVEQPITEEDQGGMEFDSATQSWIYVPHIEDIRTYKKMPLIIYFHGGDSKGTSTGVVSDSLPKFLYKDELKVKALVVCPTDDGIATSSSRMTNLLNQIKSRYSIDEKRISVTGHSTGSYKSMQAVMNLPGTFAACVPVSLRESYGYNDIPRLDCAAKFIFESTHDVYSHGVQPSTIQANTEKVIDRLGNDKITYYTVPRTNHGSVTNYYKTSDLLDWMISQSR